MNSKAIGRKLVNLRGDRTQKEVAAAIGTTEMAVSLYERGERIPRDEIKLKIADYYHQSVSAIFFDQEVNQMST